MFKKFTTREMIFLALIAAANFVLSFALGGAVVAATGIPLASAFVTGIVIGFVALLTVRFVPKFGSLTIMLTIFSILELPTALGGAPGFWPKIVINVAAGLLADIWFSFAGYKNWAIFVAFYIVAAINLLLFAFFLWLLGVPGFEKLIGLLGLLIPAYWVLGTAGIFLGIWTYKRIKDKPIARMIGK